MSKDGRDVAAVWDDRPDVEEDWFGDRADGCLLSLASRVSFGRAGWGASVAGPVD